MIHKREAVPAKVWTVLEHRLGGAEVVAVKSSEGAARIAAKVQRTRWSKDDAWRVTVTGPHEVRSDYI